LTAVAPVRFTFPFASVKSVLLVVPSGNVIPPLRVTSTGVFGTDVFVGPVVT
jgi:hypothetical protein